MAKREENLLEGGASGKRLDAKSQGRLEISFSMSNVGAITIGSFSRGSPRFNNCYRRSSRRYKRTIVTSAKQFQHKDRHGE